MEKIGWKVLAVISLILLFSTWVFLYWGIKINEQEIEQTNECYYNLCSDYPQAELDGDVCFCYGYDTLGNYIVKDTIYMND